MGLFAPGFSTASLSGGKNAVCMGSASAAISAAYVARWRSMCAGRRCPSPEGSSAAGIRARQRQSLHPRCVRHERCSAALSLLNTPQKGLQIENMAAFLCIGVQSRCLLSNGIAGILSSGTLAAGQHGFGKIGHAFPCQRTDSAVAGRPSSDCMTDTEDSVASPKMPSTVTAGTSAVAAGR